MYVFMQFDTATCRMNSNQFEFMRHVVATKCRTRVSLHPGRRWILAEWGLGRAHILCQRFFISIGSWKFCEYPFLIGFLAYFSHFLQILFLSSLRISPLKTPFLDLVGDNRINMYQVMFIWCKLNAIFAVTREARLKPPRVENRWEGRRCWRED